jgi:amidase
MNRRSFVGCGTAAGVAAFVRTGAAQEAAPGAPVAVPSSELAEATLGDLQKKMASGELSALRLAEACLSRIAALDRQGPELRSVIETNPEALAIAGALDAERAAGRTRGPLHGIPVLLKDNIDTADRMATTAGSFALEGDAPPRDAPVAARLREAGAVLLGKANLSEWANFRSSRSVSGWSARGGQCRNPYALDRNPCGSSSGSGVAVSASLVPLAVGTETDGSIVCPSTNCGIVGIKPTVGLVSGAGIVPISHTQDTAGPMARTVADAAALLTALAGAAPASSVEKDYAKALDANGLRGARIGVARNLAGFHPDTDRLFEEAVAELRRRGAEVVDPADVPNVQELDEPELEVLLYEFKAGLNAYLASRGPKASVKTLADAIAFNEKNRGREMPFFGQELFLQAQEKGPLTTPEYREALEKNQRLSGPGGIDAVMDEQQLDALVAPTGGPAWVTDLVNGDHYGGGFSTAAAVAGYPHVTVPAGYVFGLPVGISFFGRAWSEPVLLRIAYAFEQATQHRHAPRFLPTAELEERGRS